MISGPADSYTPVHDPMKLIHRISQKIAEKKPLPNLLNEIMESSKLLMRAEASSLLLYEPENKVLSFFVATGDKSRMIKKFSVELGVGIAGWVAKHKQPLLVKDCYADPRFDCAYDKKTKFHTKSMICVPLIRKKKLIGVIQVINKLDGGEFGEEDLEIFETLAAYCAIAIENARLVEIQVETEALNRELETARDIQQALLPSSLPAYEDMQVAAKLIPAKQVGGDYYNIIKINDNQSLFFIADVSGKGIPAALIVSTINSCLSSYIMLNKDRFDLMSLVTAMNKVLIESTTSDKFATCWFGLYHHEENELVNINAGHNPPYLFRKGSEEPIELTSGSLFLGGFDVSFRVDRSVLKTNDVLVIYTDGVTEAWNKRCVEYSEARLKRVVRTQMHRTAEEILDAIERDVQDHVGKARQSDDFTCMVVRLV